MGSSVGAAFWDDPAMTVEWAFTAGGDPLAYAMASCEYDAVRSCWTRTGTASCTIEPTGVGAPYFRCGSSDWYVIGPETGEARLWRGDSAFGWRPVQNVRGAGLTQVDVAVRGHSCLAGPFCP
jgi:hypothetical protein